MIFKSRGGSDVEPLLPNRLRPQGGPHIATRHGTGPHPRGTVCHPEGRGDGAVCARHRASSAPGSAGPPPPRPTFLATTRREMMPSDGIEQPLTASGLFPGDKPPEGPPQALPGRPRRCWAGCGWEGALCPAPHISGCRGAGWKVDIPGSE